MIKSLLVNGGGMNPAKINLEPTGIILAKVSMDASTSPSVFKAIQDIRQQLPANYHIFADGDANIIGRFIQQQGSPRLFNPIKQAPMPQQAGGVLVTGAEYWYGVTSLMPDGKETLCSNLMSTVDYPNYFDPTHISSVDGSSCPALLIKPVPGQVGFVVRRSKAYKTAASMAVSAAPVPKNFWDFSGASFQNATTGGVNFAGDLASFGQIDVAVLNTRKAMR